MKSKSWVTLILSFVTVLSLIYGFVQKGFADEMQQMAEERGRMAEMNAMEANRQKDIALRQAEEAKKLQAELDACRQKIR